MVGSDEFPNLGPFKRPIFRCLFCCSFQGVCKKILSGGTVCSKTLEVPVPQSHLEAPVLDQNHKFRQKKIQKVVQVFQDISRFPMGL